jgi:hypothetical protein
MRSEPSTQTCMDSEWCMRMDARAWTRSRAAVAASPGDRTSLRGVNVARASAPPTSTNESRKIVDDKRERLCAHHILERPLRSVRACSHAFTSVHRYTGADRSRYLVEPRESHEDGGVRASSSRNGDCNPPPCRINSSGSRRQCRSPPSSHLRRPRSGTLSLREVQ